MKGNVLLQDCTSLTHFPTKLQVGGNIMLSYSDALVNMKPALLFSVGKDLKVIQCKNFVALPEGMLVNGDLSVHACENFTTMPSLFGVKGHISIVKCG